MTGLIGWLGGGLLVWLLVGLSDGLLTEVSDRLSRGQSSELILGLILGSFFGLLFGLIAGLIGGGDVVAKHFILRFFLWWNGQIPWNYARFLGYATSLIFLRKVGGGYIFVHRLVMEHFTNLGEKEVEEIAISSTFTL